MANKFSAIDLETALAIAKDNKIDKELLVKQHLSLLHPVTRRLVEYCLDPPDRTKSPCWIVLEGGDCPEGCPLNLGNLCQMIGVPPDRKLAADIITGSYTSSFTGKTLSNLRKELL